MIVIDRVQFFYDMSGRGLTTDNLNTSVPLVEMLLDRKITHIYIRTVRHNRKGVPKEIKSLASREENSTQVTAP